MDKRIGAQYYTLRDYAKTMEDFEETCKKVSAIGYKTVQISGTPLEAARMREVLDRYGLEVVTTHRSFEDFRRDPGEVMEYNRTLGSLLCGVGSMPGWARESGENLDRFLREANETAALLRREGMFFGYHNHAFEFARVEGKRIMDRLIGETDPEAFYFIADTYWIQVGGADPASFIRRLGSRAMAVHFKDLKANTDNSTEMAEIGEGNLDWDGIIEACEEAGVKWALVEQDVCRRNPFESMKISYDYLTGKGFR
ncbi:MAG: sugar phosphate isomerase/epimerase [Roseburia sp.]|nr:sugar phosphate isomerase/epimerase [Roseburia sp.]MCM1098003.1 sugar phosphate isomerase/epimerase [Ruminococcus flavefaciens]